ncbi:MAG TPA: DUF1080 domain-containing protein [Puia sp.]|uniref:3-keto-disaccharide hydrolase n=1 Tax=Puia sp. TaxID=2045100 RepID=UPI002C2CDD40|nr:DUF1080 domain-containing protein [Puia sp.]HVU94623.1 DUF1080 domain-containing protein [Puia sp.]
MKLALILLASVFLAGNANAQKAPNKVIEAIRVFPYQHRSDADAALTTMNTWDKSEWKAAFRLLDNDSLKASAADALSAYINAAKNAQTVDWIKKYSGAARSQYAQLFIQSQLNLLTDKATVDRQNATLPALPAYTPPSAATLTGERQLLLLEDEMALAKNPIEKKRILAKAATIPGFSSFILVSKSINDPELNKDAALILARLALTDETIQGPVVRQALETALPLIGGEDSAFLTTRLTSRLRKMPYDHGFVSLFNGVDLTGWKALVGNPVTRSKMTDAELAAAQKAANEKTKGDWVVKDGLLIFTGHGENLATEQKYRDVEMYVDWKITEKGDAGIYLRGSPQVQIWDTSRREVGAQVGSGGLYNNQKNESKPLTVADNKIGEWNRFHIIMKGEKVTVWLNGILVTDNITLENYWDRSIPIFPTEQIELQAHGTYVAYRNIYLRELPTNDVVELPAEEKRRGFVSLFNGQDLDQWTGNTTGYLVKDGVVEVAPEKGGGNLYTKEEFANFIYRFEFQLTPGANNGIGIRAPLEGDAAYVGMEIQVLDNEAPMYKDLHPYQFHGSVYGVIPAKRGYLLPAGQWNKEEIIAKGNKIKVTLNGTVILDGDIKEASKNGTMDHKDHPGLLNQTGHLGFLGHGDVVRFRAMRVKRL